MNKKKRTAIIFGVLTSLTCLTACDSKDTSTASNESTSETTAVTETTEAVTTSAETTKTTTSTTSVTTEITTEETIPAEETDTQDKESSISECKAAYKKLIEDEGYNTDDKITYDLIYLNEDDIPELSLGMLGGWVSVYTYSDGEIHTIMDQWGYGAMGNAGYGYIPYANRVNNSDADLAGAVRYNTYMSMNDNFELEVVDKYVSYMFNDANDNYSIDEGEEIYDTPIHYIDDREATEDEIAEMQKGKYESITGDLTYDDFSLMLE